VPYKGCEVIPPILAGHLTKVRPGHHAGLGLARQASKNHRYVVTRVPIATAGDHHAITVNFLAAGWRLQANGHLRPRREWSRAAKLHPILVEDDRVTRERESGVARIDCNMLLMVV
jgi:hypothetical protein